MLSVFWGYLLRYLRNLVTIQIGEDFDKEWQIFKLNFK